MHRLTIPVLALGLSTVMMAQAQQLAIQPKATQSHEAQSLLEQANSARRAGKYDEAIGFVKKAAQAGASQDALVDQLEGISETAINSTDQPTSV